MASGSSHTLPRIALVGVGGTGCALLPLLSALPLASVTLIDGDTVEAANLPRQPLYDRTDVGRMKVDAAQERMRRFAPSMQVSTIPSFVDATNARTVIGDHDIVADCTDDLNVRFLIDRVCGERYVPLVSGAVHGSQLQVVSLYVMAGGPSLRSFFPKRSTVEQDGCDIRTAASSTGI